MNHLHPRSRIGVDLAAGPRFGLQEGATAVRVDLCHLASRSAWHRKFLPRRWSLVHFHSRLSLLKMPSGANVFEISDIQEDEAEAIQ